MKYFNKTLSLLIAAALLTGCANNATTSVSEQQTSASTADTSSTEATTASVPEEAPVQSIPEGHAYAQFADGMPEGWECADGWTNGSMFNVTWRKRNVTFDDGKMQLIINNDITPTVGIPYAGGEFRSREFYGYGRYEVSMKPIKNDGVVSSFFTYTGPSDNNPWDEIDIEFLGKDTTIVQFNYFTDSRGNHEYIHELGFDAAEDFHTYAFEWHEDKIVWYVDGEEVYTATENIPVTESKIMMNAWCGKGVDGWLNAFDDTSMPLTAEYEWVRFTPFE
ncbi:MAG: glycosyl hydrolase family protein [Ruminococcaceae bacterium]|nr:glycosyl hydrolase family protein [Oscillospiraceae bacterium]MBE6902429.1 glycosyl hydrolase family protein [Oscillospiraceae bacterium]